MRYSLLACLSLALSLVLGAGASAQQSKNEITGLRIGFPASGNPGNGKTTRIKSGHWAPVYVDVTVRDRLNKADYELLVETTDSDDLMNVYRESGGLLPPIDPNQPETLMTYVRVGKQMPELTVKFRSVKDDRQLDSAEWSSHNQSTKVTSLDALSPSTFVYLTIGDSLQGMRSALARKGAGGNVNVNGGQQHVDADENGGNRRYTNLDSVRQMPTRWFGYDSVDVVILMTSNRDFMNDLIQEKDDGAVARREALAEWVRRGGRLIISVSKNHQEVNTLLERLKIIDVKIDGQLRLPAVAGLESWSQSPQANLNNVEVAKLTIGPGVERLATQRAAGADAVDDTTPPVLVQAPAGMGRVMLVALDVNEAPFSAWRGQDGFWQRMKSTLEPTGLDNNPVNNGWGNPSNELASKFQTGLEQFPEVPVISFGWVALFILIYIIIVGPLDYFFLKKVVKRLELTWITFPTVVILISGIAYFAAYYLKGSDLRINKVDVVDIDMREPHVYGNTWLTLFSPRIQNYTVGIDPAAEWVPGLDKPEAERALKDRDPNGAFVNWMGKPDSYSTSGMGGSSTLFRRAYDYAPDSSGLKGVPIQVWSTKSFSASWHRALAAEDMDKLIEADLKFAKGDKEKILSGTLTSHLPVELDEVTLFHRGRAYRLDKLTPGQQRRIDDLNMGQRQGDSLSAWFGGGFRRAGPVAGAPHKKSGPGFNNNVEGSPPPTYVKSMLFFGHSEDSASQQQLNSNLRRIDERWRLDPNNRDEVILVGRAVAPTELGGTESAEKITQSGLSPARLWLGELPAPKRSRPALVGTLWQDTYVRIYIPVKAN